MDRWGWREAGLRRREQVSVAVLVAICLAGMFAGWCTCGGPGGALVDIDEAPRGTLRFEVDINAADWPELIQLPGVGATLARRWIHERETFGPFTQVADLERIAGIGPVKLQRMRRYLRVGAPVHEPQRVARTHLGGGE
jgi:competence protein ComEA